MAQSGTAIFYSAATVAIGIGALLATADADSLDRRRRPPRSSGQPACFADAGAGHPPLAGSAPARMARFISRRNDGQRSHRLWTRWAELVVQRPWLANLSSLALLAAFASPALSTRFGFPEGEFLPPNSNTPVAWRCSTRWS
jgi:uncharacterized membrane protein YdfJ with MMPL/SSD domain